MVKICKGYRVLQTTSARDEQISLMGNPVLPAKLIYPEKSERVQT